MSRIACVISRGKNIYPIFYWQPNELIYFLESSLLRQDRREGVLIAVGEAPF